MAMNCQPPSSRTHTNKRAVCLVWVSVLLSASGLLDGRVSSALSVCHSVDSALKVKEKDLAPLASENTSLLSEREGKENKKSLKWSDRRIKRDKVVQKTERKQKWERRAKLTTISSLVSFYLNKRIALCSIQFNSIFG